ncbi:MAG TPA: hypothetical protein V6C71_21755 [Coleofasciculaceae cyanobacterium]|jgi:hypothetical protein
MSELEQLIESNAKAIQALTYDLAGMKRDLMYSTMRDLTNKISILVSSQKPSYDLMKNLDNCQSQLANQQQQSIEILKKISD